MYLLCVPHNTPEPYSHGTKHVCLLHTYVCHMMWPSQGFNSLSTQALPHVHVVMYDLCTHKISVGRAWYVIQSNMYSAKMCGRTKPQCTYTWTHHGPHALALCFTEVQHGVFMSSHVCVFVVIPAGMMWDVQDICDWILASPLRISIDLSLICFLEFISVRSI